MSFKETYRNEVLQSRRDRSRRAFFWARITGLVLLLTIGATLRSDPELGRALAVAGMDAVMDIAGNTQAAQMPQRGPDQTAMPKSVVKVNRFGSPAPASDQTVDAQAMAKDLGRAMAAQGIN